MNSPNDETTRALIDNPEARRRLAAVYRLLLEPVQNETAEASVDSEAQDASAATPPGEPDEGKEYYHAEQ